MYNSKTKTIYVGTIYLPYLVNEVRVIDPCYDISDDVINYSELAKFVGGRYDCYATLSDEGDWGMRIASLRIAKEGAKFNLNDEIGGIAVDSGQAGFFLKERYDDKCDSKIWYDSVCAITTKKENDFCGVVEDWGVVAESGFGDGYYKVYVSKEDVTDGDYYNGAEIVFIGDEDEKEEWDEEND